VIPLYQNVTYIRCFNGGSLFSSPDLVAYKRYKPNPSQTIIGYENYGIFLCVLSSYQNANAHIRHMF
jgi:hypothetical protein